MDKGGGQDGESEMNGESSMDAYAPTFVNRQPMGICCMAQETQTGALYQPKGMGWGGKWEGSSKGKGYIYTYG